MACGLPVMYDARGGCTEFLDNGVNSFLFSGNDAALEILNYLRHSGARQGSCRLGHAANG